MGSNKNRWTKERLIKWFEVNRPEWILNIAELPEKINAHIKISYHCTICDYVNYTSITGIVDANSDCRRCSSTERWTKDRLEKWFLENELNKILDIDSLPQKITSKTKIKYTCRICQYKNFQDILHIVHSARGCISCSKKVPWNKEKIIEWFNLNRPNCKLLVDNIPHNIDAKGKIPYICKKCNHINNQKLDNIVNNGRGCAKCKSSRGEILVSSILKKLKIDFIAQYKSKHLAQTTRYRFDFALPQYKIAIEYHGEQHYIPYNFNSKTKTAEEMFAYVQNNDKRKQEIIYEAGWNYLEIPYTLKDNPAQIERLILEAIFYNNF